MQITEETQTYYKVKVFCLPEGRSVLGHRMWLREDELGCMSHTIFESNAERFAKPPTTEEIRKYSGHPRFCEHDTDIPPRIYKITRTVTVQTEEVI